VSAHSWEEHPGTLGNTRKHPERSELCSEHSGAVGRQLSAGWWWERASLHLLSTTLGHGVPVSSTRRTTADRERACDGERGLGKVLGRLRLESGGALVNMSTCTGLGEGHDETSRQSLWDEPEADLAADIECLVRKGLRDNVSRILPGRQRACLAACNTRNAATQMPVLT